MVRRAPRGIWARSPRSATRSTSRRRCWRCSGGSRNDEQDSVRLLVVEDCAKLGRLLPKDLGRRRWGSAARTFVADKSWRVRYAVR